MLKSDIVSFLLGFNVIIALLVQVARRTRSSIIGLCIVRIAFKLATNLQVGLWMDLLPPYDLILDVVFTISAIPNEFSLGKHLIALVRNGLLPSFPLFLDVVRLVAGVSLESPTIDL